MQLTKSAAKHLLQAIRCAHDACFAGSYETRYRLHYLASLLHQDDPTAAWVRTYFERRPDQQRHSAHPNDEDSPKIVLDPSYPKPLLRSEFLLASPVPCLSQWHFYKYDLDPFPSIPHGHTTADATLRLDVFTGWIYRKKERHSREPKWKIVSLWSCARFRRFALESLRHAASAMPHRDDIQNRAKMRLPRRRR